MFVLEFTISIFVYIVNRTSQIVKYIGHFERISRGDCEKYWPAIIKEMKNKMKEKLSDRM
jgi:hypothetical protein